MKAIGYKKSLPITDEDSLIDIEISKPTATKKDLLIKVNAIAVNPVDFKVRQNATPENGEYRILGWDAVGEVVAVGDDVTGFDVGQIVYYAGEINRQGSNAEFQLVDERIVGKKPTSLSDTEAAALPLTTITAWELLFDHLSLQRHKPNVRNQTNEVLLVVGAAGGVGSILLQLASVLTGATIVATASRKESKDWVKKLGAHYVLDHTKPLKPQMDSLDIGPVTHTASLNNTESYFQTYIDVMAPFGKIGLIDEPDTLDISAIKTKSLSLHWEFMFARSMFKSPDMQNQSVLLNEVSELIDHGHIITTVGENLGLINADNLKLAHKKLESRRSIGKIVLQGF